MAVITVTCPVCGGQAQIEAIRGAVCPNCGAALENAAADQGFAYAPQPNAQPMQETKFAEADMLFAQQQELMKQNMQFAPPPMPMQAQPTAMPMQQTGAAQYLYSPQQLAEAQNKRKNWYLTNSAMVASQSLMLALGILLTVQGSRLGVPLILTWVLTLPGCGAVSGLTRPDSAYIDKKPFNKTKFGAGITQFWMGAAISGAVGGILFAILAGLFGLY